jgi:PAS domain S-box-containing protein
VNWHPKPSAFAIEVVACVPLALLVVQSVDAASWHPWLLTLLLACAIASDLTAATLSTERIKISGSFLSIVVASVLLGGVPAAVIGVATILVGWLRSREAAHRLLTNVLVYAWFPLVAGEAFHIAAGALDAAPGDSAYSMLVFGVFVVALGFDFLMVAGYLAYLGGPSIGESARQTVVPLLPSELSAAVLAVGVTYLYHAVGLATIPCFAVVLLTFQYLMSELLKSEERARALERQSVELQRSRESLSAFVNAAPIVLWAVDRTGSFLLVEGEHQESLGLRSARARGASLFELSEQAPQLVEATKLALEGELVNRIIEADGLTFEAQLSPLELDREQVVGAIGVALDVSLRVQTQRENEALAERLAQAQRLDSVGQLAGGIAHDFNNLLAVILTYTSFVQHELDSASPLKDHVREIRAAADRAAELTSGLLQFSRHQPFALTQVDLNQSIIETARMLARTLGESIDLRTRLDPALWRVAGDERQVQQVLINLAVNARDAMPNGGQLTFSTENRTLGPRDARRLGRLDRGRYVCLRVADKGVGMTAEVRSRIFEPFFTTKEPGRGTGLGLATTYGMVRKAGGHIAVSSLPGKGAAFEIHWPAAASGAREADTRIAQPDRSLPRGTGETVLIAEDEDAVRRGTAMILSEHGYDVIAFPDGERAFAEVVKRRPAIDLLLTDVVMPGMSGLELADRVLEFQPGICVLFMSGYGYDAKGAEVLRSGAPLLRKPFALDTLLTRVSEELRSSAAGPVAG